MAYAVFGQKHKAAAVVMINSSDDYASYEGKSPATRAPGNSWTTIPILTVKHSDGVAPAATDGKQMTFAVNTVPNPDFTSTVTSLPPVLAAVIPPCVPA